MSRRFISWSCLVWLACGPLAGPLAAQTYFYPAQGQSAEQQNRDNGECHAWAVQQTGFDPGNPPTPPAAATTAPAGGQIIRGAARGTVVGAVGGVIFGDVGKGAAVGAVAGAALGGARHVGQNQAQAQSRQQYQAQLDQGRANYNRALAACMQGRGYSAN